jgi:hypothetical protein
LASVGQVIAGLRGVLDLVGGARQRVAVAGASWSPAASGYQETTAGSSQPEAGELASLGEMAGRQIRETEELIARCESTVRAIIDRLTGGGTAPTTLPAMHAHAADAPVPRGLPGAKAEGRWRNSSGDDVVLRSGRGDHWWAVAEQFARDRGLIGQESRASLDLSKHIETKLAMRMRAAAEQCRRHEVVRIDREVCGTLPHQQEWLLTCDKMLPLYLPPGVTLTVVEPDGRRRTYVGDEDD